MPSIQKKAAPLVQQLPYAPNSAHWFARVRDLGTPVWLDSAWPHSRRGRYDIISAAPLTLIAAAPERDFFADLRTALDRLSPMATDDDLPFHGGAIALLSYEYGRRLHALPARPDGLDFPAALAGIYSWAIVSDHEQQRTVLFMRPETPAALCDEVRRRLSASLESTGSDPAGLTPSKSSSGLSPHRSFALNSPWQDDFSAATYRDAFAKLQRYIRAGDCYQANLARRFRAGYRGDPFAAYLRLREIAAAPYSAYVEYGSPAFAGSDPLGLTPAPASPPTGAVLCLSPERFIAANGRELLTQPIKGTAPRDSDPIRDRARAEQLQRSEKNRAENLMIVDLLRNDLGRSCKSGSIRVERLFELQSFATVHHLVSSIRGELRDDLHALDALRNSFPGGSITGAPKHRAMQIIDELEPGTRSIFCGSIAYVDANGSMDSNIAIRTLLAQEKSKREHIIYAWAGGGIVADSDCEEELQEIDNKIAALLNALSAMPRETKV